MEVVGGGLIWWKDFGGGGALLRMLNLYLRLRFLTSCLDEMKTDDTRL